MWQDWVIGGVQIATLVALVPTLIHRDQKPTVSTSLLTTVSMCTLGITYATLQFWFAALMMFIIASAWLTLAYQRYSLNASARSANASR